MTPWPGASDHMEAGQSPNGSVLSPPLRWFPEFWRLSRRRLRPQMRVLGLSLVVGVISGFGAIVFFLACEVVFHYALGVGVGYHPVTPGGEQPMFAETAGGRRPWLLLVVPALGGLLGGIIVYTLAPEA